MASTALLTVVLVTAGIALTSWTRQTLVREVEALLDAHVDEIAGFAESGPLPPILPATPDQTGQVVVVDADGRVVSVSANADADLRLDVVPAPPLGRGSTTTVDGGRLGAATGGRTMVVSRTVRTDSGVLTIRGASSLESAERSTRTLAVSIAAGIPVLIGLAAVVVWRSVGQALAPVELLRREVDEITTSSLERHVTAPATDDELARLARTLNDMLDRLDEAARRERQFAADASHELRSPIAAARAQLEVGLAYPDRTDWRLTASDVLSEIDRLQRLAADLLTVARLGHAPRADGSTILAAPVDLAALVRDELARRPDAGLERVARIADVPVRIPGDADALLRVVRNLLSNAERHAVSRITVTLEVGSEDIALTVANDGRAIPAADRERIFDPFVRLDDARSRDGGAGAGLGLAIARRAVEAHGGTLTVDDTDHAGPGAAFVARFPS